MSHFIGLVFTKGDEDTLDGLLAPYDENSDEYSIFEDCTDELKEKFNSLPEKDDCLDENGKPFPHPCDKEHYPTLKDLAEDWFGYEYNDEKGAYGYYHNPDAKWDWWVPGGRWEGYLKEKEGCLSNMTYFDAVDWDNMEIPFCLVDTDGNWHEKGKMGWWACVSDEKDGDEWENEVKSYIKRLQELPDEERENIVVYAIDFHI